MVPDHATSPQVLSMKLLTRGAMVIVVLLMVAAGAVWFNLGHIVKTEVEKEGTRSLRLATTLDRARISLFGGKVSLKQFDVGSPQGFKAPQLMQLGGLDVGVKVSELRQQPLRINEMPKVEVYIVASTENPTGVGEPGTPVVAPAVANALAAATGKRLRSLPLTLA